ncbi:MAG: response regulator, partial [candidate division Zixibacteria bacterium]|nr:response regulator [candidate division Zixibacteria bacterium]
MSNGRAITILLVDDDDVDAMDVERAFARTTQHHTIVRAHDGQEALELLGAGRVPAPRIILLDLNMPRLGG